MKLTKEKVTAAMSVPTLRDLTTQTWHLIHMCEDLLVTKKMKMPVFEKGLMTEKIRQVKECLEA